MSTNVQTKEQTLDGASVENPHSLTKMEEDAEQPEIIYEKKTVAKPAEQPIESKRSRFPYAVAAAAVVALAFGLLLGVLLRPSQEAPIPEPRAENAGKADEKKEFPEWITEAYLTVDGGSRSGEKLEAVRDIALHYVANPGTSAMANRNYFEGPDSNTSAHFIVGLEGEILVLIPTDEKSCATNARNVDTVSVEVCHPDESGAFTPKTYESLIRLLAYLCDKFDLTEQNLIRHYDVTGKLCPRYYVEHPSEWQKLKADVKEQLERGGAYDEAA